MPTFEYPLALPTISGSTVSVDVMLEQPTRISRYLSDLSLRGFWADKVFTPAGGVTGGAILYTQLTTNELFVSSSRDVMNVEPGAEFPIVTFDRPVPLVKPVEKFGGTFFVTDEARQRNDPMMLQQGSQRLANTINRRIHTNAVAELDAQITALGGSAQTATANNWGTVVTGGSSQTNATGWPAADFAKVQLLADQKELGVVFDTWILNPADASDFDIVYGEQAAAVRANHGIRFITSNRVAVGTAYVIESGAVGEMRLEKPMTTETEREMRRQITWVQSDVRPVFIITNPYGIAKGDDPMTKRVIKTGVGSYVDKRGNPTWGYRGDEVDVNDDYLEEFDAMNLEVGDGKPVVYERVGVDVVSPKTAADKKADDAEDDDSDDPDSWTVPELKASLDEAGVDYPSDARKPDLVKLAKKA